MSILAILKAKGGVGSSTLAANLGGVFHSRGLRVVVLDADEQQSLTSWAGFGETAGILQGIVRDAAVDKPRAFREILEKAQVGADVVIVDCAPGFTITALEALRRADVVLIPSGPSPLDIGPAAEALEVANACRDGRERPAIAFVPSKNLPRTKLGRDLPASLEALGAPVLPGISARVAVAESVICGQTIGEYQPESDSAREFETLGDTVRELLP